MRKKLICLFAAFLFLLPAAGNANVTDSLLETRAEAEKNKIDLLVGRFRAWFQVEQASGGNPETAALPTSIFEGTNYDDYFTYENGTLLLSLEAVPPAVQTILRSKVPGQNVGDRYLVSIDRSGFSSSGAVDTSNFISRLTGGTFETGANLTFQSGGLIMSDGRLDVNDIFVNGTRLSQLDDLTFGKGFSLVNPSLTGTLRGNSAVLTGTFRLGSNNFTIDQENELLTASDLYANSFSGGLGDSSFFLSPYAFRFRGNELELGNTSSGMKMGITMDSGGFALVSGGSVSLSGDTVYLGGSQTTVTGNMSVGGNMTVAGESSFSGATFRGDVTFLEPVTSGGNVTFDDLTIAEGGKLSFNGNHEFRLKGNGDLEITSNKDVNVKTKLRVDGKQVITENDLVFTDVELSFPLRFPTRTDNNRQGASTINRETSYGHLMPFVRDVGITLRDMFGNRGANSGEMSFDTSVLFSFDSKLSSFGTVIPPAAIAGTELDKAGHLLERKSKGASSQAQLYMPYGPDGTKIWITKRRIPMMVPGGYYVNILPNGYSEGLRPLRSSYTYGSKPELRLRYNSVTRSMTYEYVYFSIRYPVYEDHMTYNRPTSRYAAPSFRLVDVVDADGNPIYARKKNLQEGYVSGLSEYYRTMFEELPVKVLSTDITDTALLREHFGTDIAVIGTGAGAVVYDGAYGVDSTEFLDGDGNPVPLKAFAYEVREKDVVFFTVDREFDIYERDVRMMPGTATVYPFQNNRRNYVDALGNYIRADLRNRTVNWTMLMDELIETSSEVTEQFPITASLPPDILTVTTTVKKSGVSLGSSSRQLRINYNQNFLDSLYAPSQETNFDFTPLTAAASLLTGDYYVYLLPLTATTVMYNSDPLRHHYAYDMTFFNSGSLYLSSLPVNQTYPFMHDGMPSVLKNLFSDGDTFNAVFYSTMQPTVNTACLFNTTITGIRTETRLRQKVFPAGLNLVTSVEDVTTGETVDGTYTLPVGYTSIPIPKEAMANGSYSGDDPVVHTTFSLSNPASWGNRFLKFSHLMDNVRARGLLLPMYLFLNN